MKVKVRGIYSTAITKLLVDEGVEITQANDAIKELFKADSEERPSVIIEDIETKAGVYVYGSDSDKVIPILRKVCKSSVFYEEDIGKIYCGIIESTDQASKSIVVSLGDGEQGVLDLKNYWGYVKPGSKILVQSKGSYDGKAMLSTQIRLFGEDLIIIKNGFTKMSRGIHSKEGKDKLYDIAKNLDLKDWGILWTQSAEDKDEKVLKEELASLIEQEKEVSRKFEEADKPGLLYSGVKKYFVLISKEDKYELDKIRGKAMPTITGHHSLKSAGYTILTDFAEEMLGKIDEKQVADGIRKTLDRYGPVDSKLYKIIITRPNGTSYRVEGIATDIHREEEVKRMKVLIKGNWGSREYEIDSTTGILTVRSQESEERVLSLGIEIFPKFAKLVDVNVHVKMKGQTLESSGSEAISKMLKKGEITQEFSKVLEEKLSEMEKI
ncbi:MAG: ribonuclease E/G [Candidatus Parvarchaeota archaeon]|nr:ribonuclease E/G [Candidatus Parvarchaeota archaeon]MCW1301699.1 ribonuclease E/G [Candidatus Parvarchaeota archaeon]